MARLLAALITVLLCSRTVEAGVTRLQVDRRETVLNGKPFGAAGPYETLIGKVHFALDEGFLLAEDVPAVIQRAAGHYDWGRR